MLDETQPTVTETSPGKTIKIRSIKLQQSNNGSIVNMTGTTFDLLEMVINFGSIPQGGLANTELLKRGKLWNAIEKQKPEQPEADKEEKSDTVAFTPDEIIERCPQVIITEKKFKYLQKIMTGMRRNMAGKDIQDFIVEILPDTEEGDE